jgi:hypothetical protein
MSSIRVMGTGKDVAVNGGDGSSDSPYVPRVGCASQVLDLTLTTDTSAYASGDLIADTQELANAVTFNGGTAVVQNIVLLDRADQTAAAIYLVFLKTNVTLGTENSAPSISDDNAGNVLGIVKIESTDWFDLGGAKVATVRNIGLLVEAAADSTSIYVGVINDAGTPTFAADSLRLKVGVLQD